MKEQQQDRAPKQGRNGRRFLRFLSRHDLGPPAEYIKALHDQFQITLQAYRNGIPGDRAAHPAYDHVKGILDDPPETWSWKDAYAVEQQLVHLHDAHTLRTELHRRTLEAAAVLQPAVADWYRDQWEDLVQAPPGPDREDGQRALLLRLINDLQWHYTVNEAKHAYARDIARRITRFFIFTLIQLLMVGYWITLTLNCVPAAAQNKVTDATLEIWVILLVVSTGAFGAAFSMITSLKQRMQASDFDELKINRDWSTMFARASVGAGGALVLFYLMRSGLLEGDLFASQEGLHQLVLNACPAEAGTLPKLLVWCFIAGFSERLVRGLLAKLEGQISDKGLPPLSGYRASLTPGAGPAATGSPDQPGSDPAFGSSSSTPREP